MSIRLFVPVINNSSGGPADGGFAAEVGRWPTADID